MATAQQRRQGQLGAVVSHDGLHLQTGMCIAKLLGTVVQMLTGDVDGTKALDAMTRLLHGLQQQTDLAQRAGAEFHQFNIGPDAAGHGVRMAFEDPQLGASGVVLGQFANGVEQRRTRHVVEVFGRNGVGSLPQTVQQVGAKSRFRDPLPGIQHGVWHQHGRSLAKRMPLNCQRAEGGKKLR